MVSLRDLLPSRAQSWALIGNLTVAMGQWALVVILARLGSPHLLGIYATAMAVILPIVVIAQAQLRNLLAVDVDGRLRWRNILTLRICGSMVAILVLLLGQGWGIATGLAILILASSRLLDGFADITYGHCQRRFRQDLVAWSQIIHAVAMCLAAVVAMSGEKGDLHEVGVALLVASGFTLLLVDLPLLWRLGVDVPNASPDSMSTLTIFQAAMPLTLAAGMGLIEIAIPRLVLAALPGYDHVGFFMALFAIHAALTLIASSFAQGSLPQLSYAFAKKNRIDILVAMRQLLLRTLIPVAIGAGIGMLWAESILTVMFGTAFSGLGDKLRIALLLAMPNAIVAGLNGALLACGAHRSQAGIQFLAILTVAGCAWWLIPISGILGALLAMGSGITVHVIGKSWVVMRHISRTAV